MSADYGYRDGSEEYFITIDTDRCNSCGDCVEACPGHVLEMMTDDNDDLVAAVRESHRKKLKYSCAICKTAGDRPPLPCMEICPTEAIEHSW